MSFNTITMEDEVDLNRPFVMEEIKDVMWDCNF